VSGRVGIDLGATAVRVVEVAGTDSDSLAQITKVSVVPLQPGAIVGGRIKDPTAVSWALTRALKEAKVKTYGAVIGLSSPDTALARISLPGVLRDTEWASVLRTSDKPISPKLPIGRSSLSLYSLEEQLDESGTVALRTLMAAAALDDEVELLRQVCRASKVTPRAIDLAGAATMRCLTRSVAGNDDVATLVDVGASKIAVATRQGLHLRSLRTIEGGGDRITRSIMGVTGSSYDQAEELKLLMRLAAPDQARRTAQVAATSAYGHVEASTVNEVDDSDVALESMTSSCNQIIDDIAAAMESDAAKHPNAPTQGILLCGGASLLRGFKDQLVQRVGVPAVVGRPWARIVAGKRTSQLLIDGTEDPVLMLGLATATGLALWKEIA
jgi:type IV pilus assembly protein PilM